MKKNLKEKIKEVICKVDGAIAAVLVAWNQRGKTPDIFEKALKDLQKANQELQNLYREINN